MFNVQCSKYGFIYLRLKRSNHLARGELHVYNVNNTNNHDVDVHSLTNVRFSLPSSICSLSFS